MYTVYILHSERINKYYIGSSSNVQDRLRKHNNVSKGFTNTGRPWLLVYIEEFENKADASAREKQLKKWKSRTRLESLIKAGSEHPELKSRGT
jgi:putative endonuclease